MMNLIKKYWEMRGIRYLFFGGLATVVSIFTFWVPDSIFQINYLVSNVISWVITVIFAFFTNKYFVFRSKERQKIIGELFQFALARFSTLFVEMLILWLGVTYLFDNELFWKIVAQIVIIILNYFAGKFIFKEKIK